MFKESMREIASKYTSPQEFKDSDLARYEIARSRGWLKDFFPGHSKPLNVSPIPEEAQMVETPSDADLRHAVDDYIVNLRVMKKQKGERPKIHISRVIRELEKILKEH